ncbi:hypothetical protein BH23CYA1_BH23CYA1_02840 [soil metagenome]
MVVMDTEPGGETPGIDYVALHRFIQSHAKAQGLSHLPKRSHLKTWYSAVAIQTGQYWEKYI